MTTATDVLQYIRSLGHQLTGEVQAQKLVYYAQAWTVTWDGTPLFDEPIHAWEMGPVVDSLRHCMGPQLSGAQGGSGLLTPQQRENVRAVVAYYGAFSGKALTELTHSEAPWRETFLADGASNHETIPLGLMRAEYTRQSIEGRGPKRVLLDADPTDADEIRRLTDKAVQQWGHTLALLAK